MEFKRDSDKMINKIIKIASIITALGVIVACAFAVGDTRYTKQEDFNAKTNALECKVITVEKDAIRTETKLNDILNRCERIENKLDKIGGK